ncbi:MAG: nucleotidyltransferase domain-containing protein [Spirochaetota bacterium]
MHDPLEQKLLDYFENVRKLAGHTSVTPDRGGRWHSTAARPSCSAANYVLTASSERSICRVSDILDYFTSRTDVAFAFLLGSAAGGCRTRESDVDIAGYVLSDEATRALPDVEEIDLRFPHEDELWGDLERLCGAPVDLVVLNRLYLPEGGGAVGREPRPSATRVCTRSWKTRAESTPVPSRRSSGG